MNARTRARTLYLSLTHASTSARRYAISRQFIRTATASSVNICTQSQGAQYLCHQTMHLHPSQTCADTHTHTHTHIHIHTHTHTHIAISVGRRMIRCVCCCFLTMIQHRELKYYLGHLVFQAGKRHDRRRTVSFVRNSIIEHDPRAQLIQKGGHCMPWFFEVV